MKKLCAKQNRRAKQWEFRNQFARLRISQCSCEIGKAVAKIRNAKFRNAKLARLLRKWNWHCEIEVGIAKLKLALRNWHCEIRKGCQHIAKISALLFFLLIFNICSKICTKLLKLKQEKLHKGTN